MLEGANFVPSLREYTARWGVTSDLRPGQKVMHPGPMNRGVEIDPEVDAAEALIKRQVRSGLVVRMAVLYDLLTHGPVEVKVARDGGGRVSTIALREAVLRERREGLADARGSPRRRSVGRRRRVPRNHDRGRDHHPARAVHPRP